MPLKPNKHKVILALVLLFFIPQVSYVTDCAKRGEGCKDSLSLDLTYQKIINTIPQIIKYHHWEYSILLLLYIITAAIIAYLISSAIMHWIQKRKSRKKRKF